MELGGTLTRQGRELSSVEQRQNLHRFVCSVISGMLLIYKENVRSAANDQWFQWIFWLFLHQLARSAKCHLSAEKRQSTGVGVDAFLLNETFWTQLEKWHLKIIFDLKVNLTLFYRYIHFFGLSVMGRSPGGRDRKDKQGPLKNEKHEAYKCKIGTKMLHLHHPISSPRGHTEKTS